MAPTIVTRRTTDVSEAEAWSGEVYLPLRLEPVTSGPIAMELTATTYGSLTAGLLGYGREMRLRSDPTRDVHIDVPVRGEVLAHHGSSPPVRVGVGRALVFPPGEPATITWGEDSVLLCLMTPLVDLEQSLERLIGRGIGDRLEFAFEMEASGRLGRLWTATLELIRAELSDPAARTHPAVGRYLEAMTLDGLLLAQPHTYSAEVLALEAAGPPSAIARAVELLEERPREAWGVVRLASEVHLSVRALQDGFRREHGIPPMTYLRRVRLRLARQQLLHGSRSETTVLSVATSLGFLHPSRFSAYYREVFGEPPSTTLNRGPTDPGSSPIRG